MSCRDWPEAAEGAGMRKAVIVGLAIAIMPVGHIQSFGSDVYTALMLVAEKAVDANTHLGNGINRQQAVAAAGMISANGYTCTKMDSIYSMVLSSGLKVYCNGKYYFELEDRGGKWAVTAK